MILIPGPKALIPRIIVEFLSGVICRFVAARTRVDGLKPRPKSNGSLYLVSFSLEPNTVTGGASLDIVSVLQDPSHPLSPSLLTGQVS
jgi:hypothetical protein